MINSKLHNYLEIGQPKRPEESNLEDAELVSIKYDSNCLESEVMSVRSNPMASDFSAAECGEPMKTQFLRLNFTPIPGVDDNEYLMNKCVNFWEFLNSQPQLGKFCKEALPVPNEEEICDAFEKRKTSSTTTIVFPSTPGIEWLEKKPDQSLAFAPKQPSKYCHFTCGDYFGESKDIGSKERLRTGEVKYLFPSSYVGVKKSATQRIEEKLSQWTPSAAHVALELDEWDREHPKCMDPPGHVPTLVHSFLQRAAHER